MGALTLTSLIPSIHHAMNIVSREQIGFIRAVSLDSQAARAAVNQTVISPVVGAMTAEDLSPANVAADTPAQTINNVTVTITKQRSVPFGVTGEEHKSMANAGNYVNINTQRIAQALRTLTNEVETDLAALHVNASRAYGTYNGTPFGTAADLSDFSQPLKILKDNGAPNSDIHLVMDTSAGARMRGKQSTLFQVNTAGEETFLRDGILNRVMGINLHESDKVKQAVTAGTAASSTTNAAGYAVGDVTITLASIGTGAFIAGDIVTFAGDTNQYVVKTGDADVSGGGTIVLQEPGLRKAIPASATAITVIAATNRNMIFHRSALVLAARAPAMPPGGDAADDVMLLQDPISGLVYEFCLYRQKRQIRYEVNLAWGVACPMPRHVGLLIGT